MKLSKSRIVAWPAFRNYPSHERTPKMSQICNVLRRQCYDYFRLCVLNCYLKHSCNSICPMPRTEVNSLNKRRHERWGGNKRMAEIRGVPFNRGIVGRCLCPVCPVQTKSSYVSNLKKNLPSALSKSPLQPQDIPGLYCSTGKATCTDIDPSQRCQCWSCTIFTEYKLADRRPTGRYCRDGVPK